jgi:hypothetical protein
VEDAIQCIIELVEEYKNIIPNANFIVEILKIVLRNSLMNFDGEYFQQIFGVIMGTNVAPILANLYMAKSETLPKDKCKTDPKLKWPCLFKRFIDDGFGIMEGSKLEFEHWVSEFNLLCDSITIDKFQFGNKIDFMDLYIYRGDDFYNFGKLDVSVFQKEENKYMYIPNKSGHQKYTIRNFVLGELRRYVRISTQEISFLKTKTNFSKECVYKDTKNYF